MRPEIEAQLLGRLMLPEPLPAHLAERYAEQVQSLPPLTVREAALLERVATSPRLVRFLDGGLALRRPHHGVRRRLLLMLALLETEPSLAGHFLPSRRLAFEPMTAVLSGVRAVLHAGVGAVLVELLDRE